jgi:hypothetical protein
MAKKSFTYLAALLLTGALGFQGCKGGSESVDAEITTDTLATEAAAELKLLEVNIPSPIELTTEISNAKFNYNKAMLNPTSKVGSYSTNFQKAVNAGVYGADLGYVVSYNQAQDGIEIFNAVNKLAKDLGLESVFDEELMKNMGANVGKKDTLLEMMDMAFNKAERNLRSNQRVSTAAVMSAGGWIEGMYLTTSSLKDHPKDEKTAKLYERAYENISSFRHVLALLDHYKKNADCSKMLDELKDLRPVIENINKQGHGVLEPADITLIFEKASAVRTKITS